MFPVGVSITAADPVNIVAILHIFSEEFLQQLLEMSNLSPKNVFEAKPMYRRKAVFSIVNKLKLK